jgi:DNA-binding PadR family transcriptional regulator
LLMAMRVQGLASPERAAVAAGLDESTTLECLAVLEADELAKHRPGAKRSGYMLTPAGAERLGELLVDEGLRKCEVLRDCYERFTLLNERILKICSEWQLRDDDVPNDHSDPSYDAAVIDRLSELHRRSAKCVAALGERASRYSPYSVRLDRCVERLCTGDHDAFTAVMAESYHTVWFELHQDLLLTLGLEREA